METSPAHGLKELICQNDNPSQSTKDSLQTLSKYLSHFLRHRQILLKFMWSNTTYK